MCFSSVIRLPLTEQGTMAIAAGDNVGSHIPNSCQFESALDNCHLPSVVDASIIYAYTGKEERDSSDSSFYRQVQSSGFLDPISDSLPFPVYS
jgi:hypothetical protein